MSLAVAVDDDTETGRAADIASRLVRAWTSGAETSSSGITLLSARWEKEDDPASGPGHIGRLNG